jgi:hypothetical protein
MARSYKYFAPPELKRGRGEICGLREGLRRAIPMLSQIQSIGRDTLHLVMNSVPSEQESE